MAKALVYSDIPQGFEVEQAARPLVAYRAFCTHNSK